MTRENDKTIEELRTDCCQLQQRIDQLEAGAESLRLPRDYHKQCAAAPTAPAGWQMVPSEHTPEILKAMTEVIEADYNPANREYMYHAQHTYKAMLKAAPKPPVQEPVAWQFFDDGKWVNGYDNPKDHRANTVAAGYPVRDLYAAPRPVQECEAPSCGCADSYCKAWDTAPQPSDDAKDAARYRWLCAADYKAPSHPFIVINDFDSDKASIDAAIDAVMAGSKGEWASANAAWL